MSTSLTFCQQSLRLLALFFFALLAAAPTAQAQWAEALPGTPDTRLNKVVIDPAGSLTVAGEFKGTLTIGTTTLTSRGHDDLFVARRSAAGVWEWAVTAGGIDAESMYGLMLLPTGDVCIAGKCMSTATFQDALGITTLTGGQTFVAKLTPSGHWNGATGLGLNGASLSSVALETTSGDVLVSGTYSSGATIGSVTPPGSAGGVFAGRVSAGGQWRWVEPVSCNNNVTSYSGTVSSDGSGGVIMTGTINNSITFGTIALNSLASDVTFIAHLTAGRTWQWAKLLESAAAEGISAHTVDAAGNSYLTGYFEGVLRFGGSSNILYSFDLSRDLYIAKIDAQGQWQWGTMLGGYGYDFGTSVCVDNAGSVYVGGTFQDTTYNGARLVSAGFLDGMVLRLNANGRYDAAASFGGVSSDGVTALAINPSNGHMVASGMFDSPTLIFDPSHTFTHNGGSGTYSSFIADFSSLLRPLGTAEDVAALARLTLSPNPAHNAVWLNLPAALHGPAATGTLLDGVGRVVRSFNLTGERTRLDIGGLAPGLYTIRVGALTRRVVVE